ncbi:hypothetical protein EK599_10465 [Vibrio sp. T187]|uniref:hypothetical protein n=1 Tax=Vibrio TaxID=662 RepID=UPI0010CA1DF0|nr:MULTISPECIES: hypothetical protein [Vibrio]MBW3696122.1 hypothetical protein [Vibrio sp. T187]
MRKIILFTVVLLFVGCSSLGKPDQTAATVQQSLEEISSLLSNINKQLSGETELEIDEATITLIAHGTKSVGGGFEVVSSGNLKSNSSNIVRLAFTVEPTTKVLGEKKVDEDIVYIVSHLAEAVKVISKNQDTDLKSLVVEMGMSISTDKSGGINIEFFGIGLNAEANESNSLGNSIKIKLVQVNKKQEI